MFLKLIAPPAQFPGTFIRRLQKGRELETMCIHLKVYEIIFVSFCGFLVELFNFFCNVSTAVCYF